MFRYHVDEIKHTWTKTEEYMLAQLPQGGMYRRDYLFAGYNKQGERDWNQIKFNIPRTYEEYAKMHSMNMELGKVSGKDRGKNTPANNAAWEIVANYYGIDGTGSGWSSSIGAYREAKVIAKVESGLQTIKEKVSVSTPVQVAESLKEKIEAIIVKPELEPIKEQIISLPAPLNIAEEQPQDVKKYTGVIVPVLVGIGAWLLLKGRKKK